MRRRLAILALSLLTTLPGCRYSPRRESAGEERVPPALEAATNPTDLAGD